MSQKLNKLINNVKSVKSLASLRSLYGRDALIFLYNNFPEIKNHIDILSKGSVTIKTEKPHSKLIKFNFKIVDFESYEDEGIFYYVDLLIPENFSMEDKLFVVDWVKSYVSEEPYHIESGDSNLKNMDVWVTIIKVNGVRVDDRTWGESEELPEDTKLFELFNIPYENIN